MFLEWIQRQSTRTLVIIVTLLTAGNYLASLGNGFAFDDGNFTSLSYRAQFHTFLDFFTGGSTQHWSPLFYLINAWFFGLASWGLPFLHTLHILAFALNVILWFRLLDRLTGERTLAFLTAVLVAVHPINTELADRLSYFPYLLSVSLLQGALLVGLNESRSKLQRHAFMLVAFTAALLTHILAILFPLYYALCLWKQSPRNLKRLMTVLPYALLSVLFYVIWKSKVGIHLGLNERLTNLVPDMAAYAINAMQLIGWYILNLLAGWDVVWIKHFPNDHVFGPGLVAFAIGTILAGFILQRRDPVLLFGLLWFIIGFAIFPVGSLGHPDMGMIIEPYWFYFSSVGFFLIFARGLLNFAPARILPIVFIGFILFYIGMTQRYHLVNRTEKSAAEFWLKSSPDNSVALMSLAQIDIHEGRLDEALAKYHRLSTIKPADTYQYYAHIADIHFRRNDLVQAEQYARASLDLSNNYALASNLMGSIKNAQGDREGAKYYFRDALEINPSYMASLLNLADLAIMERDPAQAVHYLERALASQPHHPERPQILSKLAAMYVNNNQPDQAAGTLDLYFKEYSDAYFYLLLANTFAQTGLPNEALQTLKSGQKAHPNDPRFRQYLQSLRQ